MTKTKPKNPSHLNKDWRKYWKPKEVKLPKNWGRIMKKIGKDIKESMDKEDEVLFKAFAATKEKLPKINLPKNFGGMKEEFNPYCKICGGCGYIGCCGIRSFLEKHVKGKTNCSNEYSFIFDILSYCEDITPIKKLSGKGKK